MKANRENLDGQVFGDLKVISMYAEAQYPRDDKYLCECLLCGNRCIRSKRTLKNNRAHTCGCVKPGRYIPTKRRIDSFAGPRGTNKDEPGGVYLDSRQGRFVVRLQHEGYQCYLGAYSTQQIAYKILDSAKKHIKDGSFEEFFYSIRGFSYKEYGHKK